MFLTTVSADALDAYYTYDPLADGYEDRVTLRGEELLSHEYDSGDAKDHVYRIGTVETLGAKEWIATRKADVDDQPGQNFSYQLISHDTTVIAVGAGSPTLWNVGPGTVADEPQDTIPVHPVAEGLPDILRLDNQDQGEWRWFHQRYGPDQAELMQPISGVVYVEVPTETKRVVPAWHGLVSMELP